MPTDPIPLVYSELRRLAAGYLGHARSGSTLQATALVHEAWVKLAESNGPSIGDEEHFLALAATVMRQILVDHAREQGALKRGGGWKRITLSDSPVEAGTDEVDLVALDVALEKLATLNPERARLVELRYFAGSTLEQAARILGVSLSEVSRRWRTTRAWLATELRGEGQS